MKSGDIVSYIGRDNQPHQGKIVVVDGNTVGICPDHNPRRVVYIDTNNIVDENKENKNMANIEEMVRAGYSAQDIMAEVEAVKRKIAAEKAEAAKSTKVKEARAAINTAMLNYFEVIGIPFTEKEVERIMPELDQMFDQLEKEIKLYSQLKRFADNAEKAAKDAQPTKSKRDLTDEEKLDAFLRSLSRLN